MNGPFKSLLFHFPRNTLYWLDAWPAGLKLNTELSRFYATTFVGVINTWECEYPITCIFPIMSHSLHIAAILPPVMPVHITTLGTLSSFGGVTLLLAVLSDLLSLLLTVHLRLAYELARGVYWGVGVKLGGGLLWGVFRGA